MMFEFFAETDKLFLLGLPIPSDDTSILGAGEDVSISNLKGCYTLSMTTIFNGFSNLALAQLVIILFIHFIVFTQLNYNRKLRSFL
jgi:hypothetical protein